MMLTNIFVRGRFNPIGQDPQSSEPTIRTVSLRKLISLDGAMNLPGTGWHPVVYRNPSQGQKLGYSFLQRSQLSPRKKQYFHTLLISGDQQQFKVELLREFLVRSLHHSECQICQEKECNQLTVCGHRYHRECLERWSRFGPGDFLDLSRTQCPVCRTALDQENPYVDLLSGKRTRMVQEKRPKPSFDLVALFSRFQNQLNQHPKLSRFLVYATIKEVIKTASEEGLFPRGDVEQLIDRILDAHNRRQKLSRQLVFEIVQEQLEEWSQPHQQEKETKEQSSESQLHQGIQVSYTELQALDPAQLYRVCLDCHTYFSSGPKSCATERETYPDRCDTCRKDLVIVRCPECGNGLEHSSGCLDFRCCRYGYDNCRRDKCDHGSSSLLTFCGHTWHLEKEDVAAACGCVRNGRCYDCDDCDDCCRCEMGTEADCGCRGNGRCEHCERCDDCCNCLIADCDHYNQGKCDDCGHCDDCCQCKKCVCSSESAKTGEFCRRCRERTVRYQCGCRIQVGVLGFESMKCPHDPECQRCLSCCQKGTVPVPLEPLRSESSNTLDESDLAEAVRESRRLAFSNFQVNLNQYPRLSRDLVHQVVKESFPVQLALKIETRLNREACLSRPMIFEFVQEELN